MMEEPINLVLQTAGTDLDFTSYVIKAFPGFDFNFLSNGRGSTSTAERQSFSFQTSTTYIVQNSIKFKDTFTVEDQINIYSFEVNTNPIVSLTGWSRFFANLVSTLRNPNVGIVSVTSTTLTISEPGSPIPTVSIGGIVIQ